MGTDVFLQASFCATLVDEWVRAGLCEAVVCPGSRSTPMALALAARDDVRVTVRVDERSASFLALGLGLSSGTPALLLTTSGTAAVEAHAAVVEAHQARVPLIVCTADRPAELHGVGAPQTIEQGELFLGSLRYRLDCAVADEASRYAWRSLGARLISEATSSPAGPGPVHLNVAFREPFEEIPGPLPPSRKGGRPWHEVLPVPRRVATDELPGELRRARRPLLVAGGRCGASKEVLMAAARLGWPVLADPRSGCRLGPGQSEGAVVVAAADALVRVPSFATTHRPDLVVRVGEAWASKMLASFVTAAAQEGAAVVTTDTFGEWPDPARETAVFVRAGAAELLAAVDVPADEGWAAEWQRAEERAQAALEASFDEGIAAGELTEPFVARRLGADERIGTIVVSSSMPVRDLEWYSRPRDDYPSVFANRGANGIDGVVATALGVALGPTRSEVVGLVGDLAYLHDLGALVRSVDATPPRRAIALVVIDNGGGGIFSFLPQAGHLERATFERLFATPQDADLAGLAAAAGWKATAVSTASGFDAGLTATLAAVSSGEPAVLVCSSDRERNVAVHEELHAAVAAALSG